MAAGFKILAFMMLLNPAVLKKYFKRRNVPLMAGNERLGKNNKIQLNWFGFSFFRIKNRKMQNHKKLIRVFFNLRPLNRRQKLANDKRMELKFLF